MSVNKEFESVLKDFHSKKKVIGMCCITPIVAARVFGKNVGGDGIKITLGGKGDSWPFNGSIDVAKGFGNELCELDVHDICVDEANKIVTSPAYMKGDAKPHEVYDGIEKMINSVA